MSNDKPSAEITTPPGIFVFGDMYEPETEDFDGNPLVIKTGVDKGKPTQLFVIGIAVAKTQPGHWASEPGWGQTIWATGHAGFPGGEAARDTFSWKIYDGDATAIPPKSKSKVRPCDREGWKGNWILRLQSAFAPSIYNARVNPQNPTPLNDVGAVLPGDVIQVIGTVKGNSGASPGVYLNHNAVAILGTWKRINPRGVDVKGKFGGALPAGSTVLPPAASMPAPAAPVPALPPQAPYTPPAAPPAAAAPPTAVVPAPGIVGVPVVPAAPPAPPVAAPPPPAAPKAHKGIPIASYLAGGWTMDQLRADGFVG